MSKKKLRLFLVPVSLTAAIASFGCHSRGVDFSPAQIGGATPPQAALLPSFGQSPTANTTTTETGGVTEYGDVPRLSVESGTVTGIEPLSSQAPSEVNRSISTSAVAPDVGSNQRFAKLDDQSSREEVVASADYLAGVSIVRGPEASAEPGWYQYTCFDPESRCYLNHYSFLLAEWSTKRPTRDSILATTVGWAWQDTTRHLESDYTFPRIERYSSATTDGFSRRDSIEGYMGTLEYSAFGVGVETSSNINDPSSIWADVQGAWPRYLPGDRAKWSGRMLGHAPAGPGEHPFVEGLATVDFFPLANDLDVRFSEITSLDGRRVVSDFGFEGLKPNPDGTISDNSTGIIFGAVFGPDHEEVAGAFHHSITNIFGSFGARRVPDTLKLEDTQTTGPLIGFDGDEGHEYEQWGLSGKQFQENVFSAILEQKTTGTGNSTTYHAPYGRIEGTPSGHNPVSGFSV